MTFNYYEQMKDNKHNTRIVEVAYTDSEKTLVFKTADLIEKTTPCRYSSFDNSIIFEVNDREDFENLKALFEAHRAILEEVQNNNIESR